MEAGRRPRQARGEERRERILRATLHAIGARGIGTITHRSIAAQAGVPLGSLTYYFPSKDDLLREALVLFVEEEVARLRELGEGLEGLPPEEIAQRFAGALENDDPSQVAQFELYFEVSRTPTLRGAATACLQAYHRVAEQALRAAGAPDPIRGAGLFVALIDGIALHRMAAPAVTPELRSALLALFGALTAEP